ncbi:MAG: hypothetical protein GF313_17010 [Caldithrix sp.]|nr:hypothetical protein [Caldithrix sp.]
MTAKHPTEDRIKQICEIMGEDLDNPACREVMEHINSCPTCKVYYDTMKKTIFLCRENDCPEELPQDVNERLMKKLKLNRISLNKDNDQQIP